MSTIASASTVVAKKRKASQDSSISAERPLRKDSEAAASSQASEDTTTIALRTLLDGSVASSAKTTSTGPPKKRKTSFDKETVFAGSASSSQEGPLRKRKLSHDAPSRPRFSSIGSVDDAALGLAPIGSASESHASEDHHAKLPASEHAAAVLDHLEALGDESASIGAHKPKAAETDSHSSGNVTMTSGNQRLLMEALMMGGSNRRRDRFESWGGMSDISLHMGSSDQYNSFMDGAAAAAAIAASALQSTIDEVNLSIALPHGASCQASVTSSVSGDHDRPVPSRISLNRDRKHSLASLSEGSSSFHQFTYGPSSEITPDIQAFVAAAMATVGDQLAELAGVVETCAEGGSSVNSETMKDPHDDHSIHSAASSLTEIRHQGRERSFSTSSNPIAVDIDAVAAAVNAAEAATGALDLAHFASVSSVSSPSRSGGSRRASERAASVRKPSTMNLLPAILPIPPLPPSTKSERDMEAIRARARAAAGYVPPSNLKPGEIPQPQPVKKRPRPLPKSTAHPPKAAPSHCVPDHAYSMYNATNKASAQKWDEMYECLLRFVEERRKVETKGMTEKEKKDWGWDGNVPTTYKAKDGKALGRWINNQRSAKHKGSLKKDREVKLLRTGLKWSVLSTNTWQDMMDELRLYVEEKTKGSGQWDGNVPTNYKIKGSRDENGEEKNLGRWINRQRSLYQSGKLRKDREIVSLLAWYSFPSN
jgi:hypothetical protein